MIWWILAPLCAFFIKGLCGFANTLIFTSILSFGTSNINISPVELVLGCPTNMILAWKERKSIDWRLCVPVTLLILAGSIPGILLLKNADARLIKILFGVVIILIGVEMLLRDSHERKLKPSKLSIFVIGLVTGGLCGLFGIGVLLAAYLTRITENSRAFKGTLCMVFTVENIFRIAAYAWAGIVTVGTIKQVVMLAPVMLIGLFAGMKSFAVLDEARVKKLVIIMIIVSGAALVLTNL